ncbi:MULTISPECIES: glycosyltransferase family 2 protein [Rhodobacterales]|uniref:glycosyltransferase family 2 protein n=1 Tax=Rhodobacterales TaxID=204455 RepID=UPI00215DA747|nr:MULTISPECIES: glycosyltransferase family 2 protein [Rhodobacterales]MDO6590398.1 glycosyltransferase family 2 protein [Yoonia sp. 1_MG-2023]
MRAKFTDAWLAYRLRWKRRRILLRIWRNRKQIELRSNRTKQITPGAILAFSTVRNEMLRLPHFLDYYRKLGVAHFLIVDNASTDGTADFLAKQSDVSLWTTSHSYKLSRFGMDWLGWLQWQYGSDHWCLTVDADELLVYPQSDSRDLQALTAHLDSQGLPTFGALMLDMYPQGPLTNVSYKQGQDPVTALGWFDGSGYRHRVHPVFGNQWIQGGVRDRVFFQADPDRAPSLNKTPLVKWHWRNVYVTSTHHMLPRRLNQVFDWPSKTKMTGVLLHTKFLPDIAPRSSEEMDRQQHFENSALYAEYYQGLIAGPDLWTDRSMTYKGWEQLVELGLIAPGEWR